MIASVAKIKIIFSKSSADIKKLEAELNKPPSENNSAGINVGNGNQFMGSCVAKHLQVGDDPFPRLLTGKVIKVKKRRGRNSILQFEVQYDDGDGDGDNQKNEVLTAEELLRCISLFDQFIVDKQNEQEAFELQAAESEILEDIVRRECTEELVPDEEEFAEF